MAEITETTTSTTYGSSLSWPSTIAGAGKLWLAASRLDDKGVDYEILKLQAGQKDVQAKALQVKAEQEANVLREQYSQAAGAYTYGMARRNVKVGEGAGRQNLEISAKEVGQDIMTMRDNAKYQADLIRADAQRMREGAEDLKEIVKWERIGDLFEGIGTMANVLKPLESGKTVTKTETKTVKTEEDLRKEKEAKEKKAREQGEGGEPEFPKAEVGDDRSLAMWSGDEQVVNPNRQQVTREERQKIRTYLAQDMSIDEISKKLKIDKNTVAMLIKEGGI
jgi:hypothetical protein